MRARPAIVTDLACLLLLVIPDPALSHGRLWDPQGRSTMWRRGYGTPVNYQDHELFCGGFAHQVSLGYKCGVCGDPYDAVRENEAGGRYATGLISRTYQQGQTVSFDVDITANHKGYIQFKICPTNDYRRPETQACFDQHPVPLSDGSGWLYHVPRHTGHMIINVTLPSNLSCEFCVVQWRYHTGNNWGTEPNGTSCVGCGYQEEFYACADVKILPVGAKFSSPQKHITTLSPVRSTNTKRTRNTRHTFPTKIRPETTTVVDPNKIPLNTTTPTQRSAASITQPGKSAEEMVCKGVGHQINLDQWCQMNCQLGFCPQTHCRCTYHPNKDPSFGVEECRASKIFRHLAGYNKWCAQNCALGFCPGSICVC